MKRLPAIAAFLIAWASPMLAQTVLDAGPVAGAGAYNTATPTCTAGKFCLMQTDANGNLKIVGTFTSSTPIAITASTPLAIQPLGSTTFGTSQISITSAGVIAVAARTGAVGTGRRTLCLTNITGTSPIYVSGATPVTSSNGMFISGTAGASQCWDTQSIVYGISGGATQTASYSETY